MKNTAMAERLHDEIHDFVQSRKSLMLSSIQENGHPYASYAPFAVGDDCLYVLLSDIAIHAINLAKNPQAAVLIIEDEDAAEELFARRRVNYTVQASLIPVEDERWEGIIGLMASRLGERIYNLSQLNDFRLFHLAPTGGRYVKGFGRAYTLSPGSLVNQTISHLRDGHQPRNS